MAKDKVTTRDLISDLIEIESQLEYEHDDAERHGLQQALVKAKQSIEKKMENLDVFDLELSRKDNMLEAELKTYQKEIDSIKKKQAKIAQIKKFFDTVLIPMVIKEAGNDGKFETNKKRYTLYKTYGKLEIDNKFPMPNKYKKMKMEQYIDKKEARKDAIEADKKGERIPGLIVNKIERVRKS